MDGLVEDTHLMQVVAIFEQRRIAIGAVDALLEAGIAAAEIDLIDRDTASPEAIQRLIAPTEDVQQLGQALAHGNTVVATRPRSAAEREAAIEVLAGFGPVGLDGERAAPAPVQLAMNHAMFSRADLAGKEVEGATERVLDMTGRPMTVQAVSGAREVIPAEPIAEMRPHYEDTAAIADTDPLATTYTHGVPDAIARNMSKAEQLSATVTQGFDARFAQLAGERRIIGRRASEQAGPIRSYVADGMASTGSATDHPTY